MSWLHYRQKIEPGVKDLDLLEDGLTIERALGIQWCIKTDTFVFRITLRDQPLTRRGVLSTVSSIFDPLGFLAPLLLKGKQILQCLYREGSDCDSPLPDNLRMQWERWRNSLVELEDLKIQRCYKPKDFRSVETAEIHHFSDASTEGYGMCSYLRLVDDQQRVHCTLLMGKSGVATLKTVTIRRLELTAALVSVKVSTLLTKELKLEQEVSETFWTDSKIVIAYIANESRRFHVFVANRVQLIRDQTDIAQWKYVKYPADEASRGVTAHELMTSSKWLTGPNFLWMRDVPTDDSIASEPTLSNDDPEVKRTPPLATHVNESPLCPMHERMEYFSIWSHATRAAANILNIKTLLRNRALAKQRSSEAVNKDLRFRPVNVEDLCRAEKEIIKIVQREAFEEALKILTSLQVNQETTNQDKSRNTVKATSSVYRLDPFVDADGIMRVGGRIKRVDLSSDIKNPVILPRRHHITDLTLCHWTPRTWHNYQPVEIQWILDYRMQCSCIQHHQQMCDM